MSRIGIDLGGTKTEGIILNDNLEPIERKRIPTPQNDYNAILNSVVDLVNDLKTKTNDSTIGICTPGAISKKTGLIKNSNTQCLIGMPLKEDLEKALGQKVSMENDANCFAMAEAKMGAAKDYDVVFGVIMGTGVGGGIVINKKIHHGRTNIAGEWGHHTLHQNGNKCYCGKNGCVETYISGPALEKRWNELTGKKDSLPQIIQNFDDDKAIQWKNEFLHNFGTALANVIDILDPDAIVLGGGVSNVSFLYDEGKKAVYDSVFSDLVDTPILKNQLGDSAGVFGASLL
ncbi:MAG: fructokinase [Marine Group I thaumarchaeote]|nr:MAG: fructokinase [Marine Group I thaumarchaeote]